MATATKIETLLEQVIKLDASDLHLQVGTPPMLRVDGALKAVEDADALEEEMIEQLVFPLLDDDQKQILEKDAKSTFHLPLVSSAVSVLMRSMNAAAWPLLSA